jgi:hypothetical protein
MLRIYYTLFILLMQCRRASFTLPDAYGIAISGLCRKPERRNPEMTEVSGNGPKAAGVELVCNGQNVPLNPFVQRFLQETVRGMLAALDRVPEKLKTIEIAIREKEEAV